MGHGPVENLSKTAVIVGGGAIGVASAYYLSQSGWQVTIVDSGEIGGGCSYGNACLITASHSHPVAGPGVIGQALRWMLLRDSPFYVRPRLDPKLVRWGWSFRKYCNQEAAERGFEALAKLSRLSLDLFEDLGREVDFLYEKKGLLHVYLTDAGFQGATRERDAMEAHGFHAKLMSRVETLDFEPALADRIRGGLFIENEAHGLCLEYVRALARKAESQGARLLTERSVSRILIDDGKAKGVRIEKPDEDITADLVILAAGSWSPSIAKTAGLSIPLQPAKGYSCTFDIYPGAPKVPLLMPETRVIVTPLGDRLRFGGTLELAGHDLSLNEARYQAVIRGGREVLRESFEMRNEESWCGLRPVLPDGLPIIDWAQGVDRLLVATGHAMLGFTQSPGTGKVVAELANEETPSVPLDAFRSNRKW
jgi:D-amino-acid dehydrogenase